MGTGLLNFFLMVFHYKETVYLAVLGMGSVFSVLVRPGHID